MGAFTRDPTHWLHRFSPDEWIRAALGELARAEKALDHGDARAGIVGLKRAAGMALNAALIVEPERPLGRTYVEHLTASSVDRDLPDAVREACRRVLDAKPPSGEIVALRTPHTHFAVVEAARDVIAHAWAVVKRHESS
jgi:HEPN domain-containing protein